MKVSEIYHLAGRARNDIPILTAEDSPLLRKLIHDSLTKAGYTNIISAVNGQEAWNVLEKAKAEGNVLETVRCVITDIEMPQMDGHRLTKLIKTDNEMKNIPVVIFSSLVNDEMKRKGEALGADAQLSKPEIGMLVEAIDKLLNVK